MAAICLTFLEFPSNRPFRVDPTDVVTASIAQPSPLETTDPTASSKFTLTSTGPGVVYHVRGNWDEIRVRVLAYKALIAMIQTINNATSEFYAPVFVASGGGVVALVGSFVAMSMLDVNTGELNVIIRGSFGFAPAVAGVAEVITMTLPPTATPPGNFALTADAQGSANLQGLHAATDFCDPVQATVGAKTVETNVLSNAVSSPVEVTFSYHFVP